ncbi:Leupeptin-inactivating enzyme 1 [Thermoflexales bacterium]|nr:Leupeptin-inactivating enzyme 1 [Thermoflexales bacterium]
MKGAGGWLLSLILLVTACSAPAVVQPECERYVSDLTFIAQAPRPPGSAHHQAVQDLCAQRFEEAGYTVERQAFATGVNVVGRLEGKTRPDEIFIISAHYDSISDCNGADDDGSGVAAVLETSRVLAGEQHARTLVVACWDDEESGMRGSRAYAQQARQQNANILSLLVYDMIGYTSDQPNSQQLPSGAERAAPALTELVKHSNLRGNFIALLYDERSGAIANDLLVALQIAKVPALPLEVDPTGALPPGVLGGDHASFWQAGYPAMMFNDTAYLRYPGYHCESGGDDIERLNHDFATGIISATVLATRQTLNPSIK